MKKKTKKTVRAPSVRLTMAEARFAQAAMQALRVMTLLTPDERMTGARIELKIQQAAMRGAS